MAGAMKNGGLVLSSCTMYPVTETKQNCTNVRSVPAKKVSTGAIAKKKTAAPKKSATAKREPLKEQTNIQHSNNGEDDDVFDAEPTNETDLIEDESMEEHPTKQPVKPKPAGRGRKKAEAGKKEKEVEPEQQSRATEKDGEFEENFGC